MTGSVNGNRKTDREVWLDFLRGVGILYVVLGHCWPPFRKEIYAFHMPLFFMLSGYLFYNYKNLELKILLRKLAKRLLIPYFILCGIGLVIDTLMRFVAHMPFMLPQFTGGDYCHGGMTPIWR